MALFKRFFYRKPPDRLLEISERVYVFDCCLSNEVLEEDEYKLYMGGIVAELQDYFPDSSFMVYNFSEGNQRSQISDILSQYDMTVMEYPRQYEGYPMLPLEMIHHFLRSSESWLSLEGQQNVVLMHCERGGWPVLAFMLAALLLFRKQYNGEQKTLEMVYKQAPMEVLRLLTPLNPQPSQLRYLQYISRRNLGSNWPPSDTPLALDSIMLQFLPLFCRPVIRIYGQDLSSTANRSSKLLFTSSKNTKNAPYYQPEKLVKIDIHHRVQGDVVLECMHLDHAREEMIFRVMFHTSFVRSGILMLNYDEVDLIWDARDQIPMIFRAEVLFSDVDSLPSMITTEGAFEDGNETEGFLREQFLKVQEMFSNVSSPPRTGGRTPGPPPFGDRVPQPPPPPPPGGHVRSPTPLGGRVPQPPPRAAKYPNFGSTQPRVQGIARPGGITATPRRSSLYTLHQSKVTRTLKGGLFEELQRFGDTQSAPDFDVSDFETLFFAEVSTKDSFKGGGQPRSIGSKTEKVHLIDLRRVNNTERMLMKVKMPLPDMVAAILAMNESILHANQVENLIKYCPNEEEMEVLQSYTGEKEMLGKCEQFFLELMKVPRVESKLSVFLFKIQFDTQLSEFNKSLNTVNSVYDEVQNSVKLREIFRRILYLWKLNQGTARVDFKLDSLLKLTDTRASNSNMTLMHYLCKVLASNSPALLDFHVDLVSLESATKIELTSLEEELQTIFNELAKAKQELTASANDGSVSEVFHKTLNEFIGFAESAVDSVTTLYTRADKNADALIQYFGEDPALCPFEQVIGTLVNFVRLFQEAHEQNYIEEHFWDIFWEKVDKMR